MLTLFIRTLLVYIFMFVVLRLMGKRQLSDMQPFDLAITLLIANLAALPMSDPAIPLLYGVVPIIAMFALHRLISFMSLKSEKLRKLVCGSPLVMISGGVVREDAMRAANYSLFDLAEQPCPRCCLSATDRFIRRRFGRQGWTKKGFMHC